MTDKAKPEKPTVKKPVEYKPVVKQYQQRKGLSK